jgi:hypothetical protein
VDFIGIVFTFDHIHGARRRETYLAFFSIKGLARISLLRSNEITKFKRVKKGYQTTFYSKTGCPDTKGLSFWIAPQLNIISWQSDERATKQLGITKENTGTD